ncbi:tRNA-splicing endonuclease subunit Sen54 [Eublepharis macularius]|uniref:tRNA-splicing endonuclease subunit Sen54 n=1 Tax=Eublepharis macularius TaxID=481883 RepID=A0AA97J5A2_EUBMA|nr:tRNA-splicing endonuclease subunit Sen54 [Eublepharis macularius]
MEPELRPRASGHLLSPAELLAVRTRDHKIPQRSHGQKDFMPDGSEEQQEKLCQCRDEQWQLLREERVERLGSLVKAEWKPLEGIVELKSPAGKFWHTMGYTEHGKQCLLPEEALYLLECGSIQLFYKDLPLSVQEAYENLLSQMSVSLLKYQVFSHLKRLGYIVQRFRSSTIATPYEQQLNLDSHYQNAEKKHHKRKRSSSPWLHGKKPKTSERTQEYAQPPQKDKRHHESSSHPVSDGGSLPEEKVKESDSGVAVEETIPTASDAVQCYQSPPVCMEDHHESSTTTSLESQGDTCPSRWNFTTITFPNMGADCPQTVLLQPDKRLLPENVTAREVDATRWRKRLNQKHEKLSHKEREHLEWERKYKSSINEDKEVRQCSTWQEYKALLKKKRQQREKNCPAHFWKQTVTPLLKPDQGLSTADVLQQISVLQPSHILDGASQLQNNSIAMKIDFDVYPADTASSFKKNKPGKPFVRMCVRSFDEQIPTLRAVKQLAYQSGDVPVVFALVDNGDIAFCSFKEFKLPVDVYP